MTPFEHYLQALHLVHFLVMERITISEAERCLVVVLMRFRKQAPKLKLSFKRGVGLRYSIIER
jgi:hypothetical protein